MPSFLWALSPYMASTFKQLKILNSIVRLDPVFMVNALRTCQGATQIHLHYIAVLKHASRLASSESLTPAQLGGRNVGIPRFFIDPSALNRGIGLAAPMLARYRTVFRTT